MPDQPTPLWGLHHQNGAWYPFALYVDLDIATRDAHEIPGYVPAQLVPADALEAATARVAELEDLVCHCWVYSGYSDCGSGHMTTRERELYKDAIRQSQIRKGIVDDVA